MSPTLYCVIFLALCITNSIAVQVKFSACGVPVTNLPVRVNVQPIIGCNPIRCNATTAALKYVKVTFKLDHPVKSLTPFVLSKTGDVTEEIEIPDTQQNLCGALNNCSQTDQLLRFNFRVAPPISNEKDVEITTVISDENYREVMCAIFHVKF